MDIRDNHLDEKNAPDLARRRLLAAVGAGIAAVPLMGMSASSIAQNLTNAGKAVTASLNGGKTSASQAGEFLIGGDLRVNRLGYGGLQLTGPNKWGEPERREEAIQVLRRLPQLGVDFIDTADAYGPFVSEEIISEALVPYQGFTHGKAVIATKGGFVRPDPFTDPWVELGNPDYLQQCVRMSLRRLKLERIDLWHLHRVDPKLPQTQQYEAIRSFIDKGLIRHAGLSEVTVEQIKAARKIFPVATVQNHYNLSFRKHETVLNYCEDNGIAFIPWFPLANGDLTKPGGTGDTLAKARGVTPAQIAIAWLLKRSPVMLPIPGTSRLSHLEENVASASIKLTDREFEQLDRLTRPS